jgi:hypothetical protein
MTNQALDTAVERLLCDRRFLKRFRRRPERALRPYGLSCEEVAAVKRGDSRELMALGLDPELASPSGRLDRTPMAAWLLRNASRLAPASVLAATALVFAPAASAPAGGRRREFSSNVKIKRAEESQQGYDFAGALSSSKAKCERGRDVLLWHRIPGADFLAGSTRTAKGGKWEIGGVFPPPGDQQFYAVARESEIAAGICEEDKSPKFAVRVSE